MLCWVVLIVTLFAGVWLIARLPWIPGNPTYTYNFNWKAGPDPSLRPMVNSTAPWTQLAGTVLLSTHSQTSDTDGELEIEDVIRYHQRYSFGALAITDHNTFSSALEAQQLVATSPEFAGFIILVGMEYSSCLGHFNILFGDVPVGSALYNELSSDTLPAALQPRRFPTQSDISAMTAAVHQRGGIVIGNHIPWSLGTFRPEGLTPFTADQMFQAGVDCVEVVNHQTFDPVTLAYATANGSNNQTTWPLCPIAATDFHYFDETVYGWTIVQPTAPTANAVIAALQQHKTDFLFDARGVFKTANNNNNGPIIPQPWKYPNGFELILPWINFQSAVGSSILSQKRGMVDFQGGYCVPIQNQILWVSMLSMAVQVVVFLVLAKFFSLLCCSCLDPPRHHTPSSHAITYFMDDASELSGMVSL